MSKIFLVHREYAQDADKLALRPKLKAEHLAYCDTVTTSGDGPGLRLGFASSDNQAAWHFVLADDESKARTFIEDDPYRKAELYTYTIQQVTKLRGDF